MSSLSPLLSSNLQTNVNLKEGFGLVIENRKVTHWNCGEQKVPLRLRVDTRKCISFIKGRTGMDVIKCACVFLPTQVQMSCTLQRECKRGNGTRKACELLRDCFNLVSERGQLPFLSSWCRRLWRIVTFSHFPCLFSLFFPPTTENRGRDTSRVFRAKICESPFLSHHVFDIRKVRPRFSRYFTYRYYSPPLNRNSLLAPAFLFFRSACPPNSMLS